MDTAITLNSVLEFLGILVAIVGGVGAIIAIVRWITSLHDKNQKYDGYDKRIDEVEQKINDTHSETEAKLQQMQAEQCMLTYCMMATLDGLHQLGCNGEVTRARSKLDKWMNKQAHGVLNDETD